MGGGKRTVETTPCEQEGRVEGRQNPGVEWKRSRKHSCGGNTERRREPERHERRPARGRRGKPLHPLAKQSKDFEFHVYNRKPAKKVGLDHVRVGHQFPLTGPEKGKDQTGMLFLHPGRHVHEISHVPDPGESQSFDDEGLTAKSQGARAPRRENMVHGVYPGAPIVLF